VLIVEGVQNGLRMGLHSDPSLLGCLRHVAAAEVGCAGWLILMSPVVGGWVCKTWVGMNPDAGECTAKTRAKEFGRDIPQITAGWGDVWLGLGC